MVKEIYSKAPPEGSTTLWAALRAAFPDAMTDTRQFEDAVANVAFMYVAGYETTSNAIMHTLSALALDQDSQTVVAEVRRVLIIPFQMHSEKDLSFLRKGITDMVRISDARMSGTAYGTVVLHTSPAAAAGGPLAVVRDGDMIELDLPNRRLHLDISDEELAARLAAWSPNHEQAGSGYAWLHQAHVQGADTGADLDFLKGCRGNAVGKDSH